MKKFQKRKIQTDFLHDWLQILFSQIDSSGMAPVNLAEVETRTHQSWNIKPYFTTIFLIKRIHFIFGVLFFFFGWGCFLTFIIYSARQETTYFFPPWTFTQLQWAKTLAMQFGSGLVIFQVFISIFFLPKFSCNWEVMMEFQLTNFNKEFSPTQSATLGCET